MPISANLSESCIIFDLDGTLVDSAPDLAGAMNHVLADRGLPPLPMDDVRHLVGNGARALIEKGLATHNHAPLSDAEMDAALVRFIDHYRDHIADKSYVFDGVEAGLDQLSAAGAHLAVCTNKREELGHLLLREVGLHDRFDTVICRDTLPTYKPAPEPLLECLTRTGAAYGVMIGDTMTDVTAARNARMPCLVASFGYGSFSPAERAEITWFTDYGDLPALITELAQPAS